MLVRDLEDGTPLAHCSNRRVMIYHPAEGRIYRCDNARGWFGNVLEEGNFKFSFGLKAHGEEAERPHSLRLDARDLLDRATGSREIVAPPDGKFELRTETERKNQFYLVYDLKREFPCVGYGVRTPGETETRVKVSPLLVNEPLEDSDFRDFDFASLDGEFVVEDIEITEELSAKQDQMLMGILSSIFIRAALRNEELRQELNARVESPIPWEKIEKNDKEMAPRLQALFDGEKE
jgi:hypothetical protein